MKIEFLEDAQGRNRSVIRLFEFSPTDIQHLVHELHTLVDGTNNQVDLHRLPWVTPINNVELTATVGHLHNEVSRASSGHFDWVLQSEDWSDVIDKVKSLRACPEGKWQWLTDFSKTEILLSKDGYW